MTESSLGKATRAQRESDETRRRERQAGIARLFSEGAAMGPGVLALQKGLIAGLARSQTREADRLEARGAPKARVTALRARVERVDALRSELRQAETGVKRVVEGLGEPGMFHGYVRLPSGAPAVGYGVRVTKAGSRAKQGRTAKTDETGYFRMEFEVASCGSTYTAETKPQAAANAATQETAVDVLDPANRVVFRDPAPPSFTPDSPPAFRFYPLLGKAYSGCPDDTKDTPSRAQDAATTGSNTKDKVAATGSTDETKAATTRPQDAAKAGSDTKAKAAAAAKPASNPTRTK